MSCEVSYEDLAAYVDGDMQAARLDEIRRHVEGCPSCQGRLEALRGADAMLTKAGRATPSVQAVLSARRAIAQAIGRAGPNEIMTLEEVAEFLRITPEQLGEIVEELPAFELAGQIRVRRTRLSAWVEQRERDFARQTSASWAARARVIMPPMGVAL